MIWTYWEGPRTPCIDLCLRTAAHWCEQAGFEFHCLTPWTTARFIDPDLCACPIQDLPGPAQRADWIRAELLDRYGGWWVDADTVFVGKPVVPTEKEVGYLTWTTQPRRALNGYLYAREESEIIGQFRDRINQQIRDGKTGWTELGEQVLTPLIDDRAEEIDRKLVMPLDVDALAYEFFGNGRWQDHATDKTFAVALNHSWMTAKQPALMSLPIEYMKDIPTLFCRLMADAATRIR